MKTDDIIHHRCDGDGISWFQYGLMERLGKADSGATTHRAPPFLTHGGIAWKDKIGAPVSDLTRSHPKQKGTPLMNPHPEASRAPLSSPRHPAASPLSPVRPRSGVGHARKRTNDSVVEQSPDSGGWDDKDESRIGVKRACNECRQQKVRRLHLLRRRMSSSLRPDWMPGLPQSYESRYGRAVY
jgi:hypothetical protein